uniref:Uncharacterized protein n=1 Tax=Trypanosoma congolense (strain IL3000) TaxID=1068625 RepID=G0UPL6_TRYCI|nr:conserved hypothetical protein [Trypanosoma congolense IL3000]
MNVSEFLRKLKECSSLKESSSPVVENGVQLSLPSVGDGGSVDVSDGVVDEDVSDDEMLIDSNCDCETSFFFKRGKRNRYDASLPARDELMTPRQPLPVLKMFKTNECLGQEEAFSNTVRRRARIPTSLVTGARKGSSAAADALREELLRKKTLLNKSCRIGDFSTVDLCGASQPVVHSGVDVDEILGDVEGLLSTDDSSARRSAAVSNELPFSETRPSPTEDKSVVINPPENSTSLAEPTAAVTRKGKMSLFARAKLYNSGEKFPNAKTDAELIEVKKFSS